MTPELKGMDPDAAIAQQIREAIENPNLGVDELRETLKQAHKLY